METSTKVIIGVGTLIVIGGAITAYVLLNKKKEPILEPKEKKPSDIEISGGSPETTAAIKDAINKGNIVVEDKTPNKGSGGGSGSGTGGKKCSQVRFDFDSNYNYKKCDGVWFTMKKNLVGGAWVSLADKKWASSVAKLNAKYPND